LKFFFLGTKITWSCS